MKIIDRRSVFVGPFIENPSLLDSVRSQKFFLSNNFTSMYIQSELMYIEKLFHIKYGTTDILSQIHVRMCARCSTHMKYPGLYDRGIKKGVG